MPQQNFTNGETYNAIRTKINENFLELFNLIQNLARGIPLPTPSTSGLSVTPSVTPSTSGLSVTPSVTPSTSGPSVTPSVTPSTSGPSVTPSTSGPSVTPSVTPSNVNESANPFTHFFTGPSPDDDSIYDEENKLQMDTTFADKFYYLPKAGNGTDLVFMDIYVNNQFRSRVGVNPVYVGQTFGYKLDNSIDDNPQTMSTIIEGRRDLDILV